MRRHPVASLLLTLATASFPANARAQLTAEDSASVLLDAAAALQAEGREESARDVYELIVDRYPGSEPAAEARRLLDAMGSASVPGDGRTELIVWTTTYGLFLGFAVPTALGADDSGSGDRAYGVGLLFGGPAGYVAGRAIARSRPLSEGQARAITLAGTWGTWQGGAFAELLDLGQEEVCSGDVCFTSADGTEARFAAMALAGVAGIAIGNRIAKRSITAGTATAVNFGALWGSWIGFAGGGVLDLEGDALLFSTVLAGNVALISTVTMAPGWNVTRNRARLVSVAGLAGLFAGGGLVLLVEPRSQRVASLLPLATSLVGLAWGAAATRGSAPVVESDAGQPASDALVSRADGRWTVDAPLPYPVVLEPRGRERTLGLGLTLLHATF